MQCHADVEMADALDVATIVVHDKELQRMRQALGRAEAVAVAGEDDLASRQRTRTHVEDAVLDGVFILLGSAEVLHPVARSGVGGELLLGQPDNLPALDVDSANVGTTAGSAS